MIKLILTWVISCVAILIGIPVAVAFSLPLTLPLLEVGGMGARVAFLGVLTALVLAGTWWLAILAFQFISTARAQTKIFPAAAMWSLVPLAFAAPVSSLYIAASKLLLPAWFLIL